jgi:uncharacterized protein (DUF58 family)
MTKWDRPPGLSSANAIHGPGDRPGRLSYVVPSERLVWLAALVVLPVAAVAGMVNGAAVPCALAIAAMALVAAFDAVRGYERLATVGVRAPQFLRLTKDVPGLLPLTVENGSAKPLALRLGVAMPDGAASDELTRALVVTPGASTTDWPVTGTARGDHNLAQIHVEARSPMGLWLVRGRRAADCELRVYPNLRDRATAALFSRTANIGLRTRRQLGKGREFDNLRQYMPGDSYEDIHWKATARRGYPAVKLYQVEHAQEVYAVIDSSRLSMRPGILESYVEAALHLALVAEGAGDRFGLVTFSNRTQSFVRARHGMDHFRLCRETIYNLKAERVSPDFRDVFSSLQLNLRRRTLLIFFTSLDDALLAETFEREAPMLARRHLVLVNVTQSPGVKPLFEETAPPDLDALYGGLAGQILWNRMRKLKIALGNCGIKLTVVDPARIKMQVTSQYLEVKRRQAL